MICKSNNNSYHDGTLFFDVFSEKDPHLNAVEQEHNIISPRDLKSVTSSNSPGTGGLFEVKYAETVK